MPWGAIIGAVVGGIGAHKKGKKADAAYDREQALREEELAIMREGLGFSKEQYADWKEKYDPIYDDMMANIDSGITPDYAAIAGDVNSSFDSAQGMERRQLQRYGIKPSDGAYGKSERDYAINRSAAHSGIRNQARQASAGEKYRRLSGIHNTMQGVGTAAGAGVRQSYAGIGAALGDAARGYGDRGDRYNAQGAAGAAGWGKALGGIDWGAAWNQAKGWFSG